MKTKKTPKPKYTFEIYQASVTSPLSLTLDLWYWRCRHRNGKIIADGAEGYSNKANLRWSLDNFLVKLAYPYNYEIKEIA